MKKTHKTLTLGDLIIAVSSSSHNDRETIAAVSDLLCNGRVRFRAGRKSIRARVI